MMTGETTSTRFVRASGRPRRAGAYGASVAVAFLFLSSGAGCRAHGSGATGGEVIELDAVEIVAGASERLELASLNDAELFQMGAAAFAAGDFEGAARAFSTLVVGFPESELHEVARYNAGYSYERMGECLTALAYYAPLLDDLEGRDWLETAYRAAECLYVLHGFIEAADLLGSILAIDTLPANDRMRALVQQGVCLLEAGREHEALHSLRSAVGRYHLERRRGDDILDVDAAARAQFHLGEIYRRRFERARLDPATTDLETLADDIEHKSELLLSAQGHYLRAIRLGDAQWATASGHQIGRLYEELYRQITTARLPTTLGGASERVAYMELLQEKVRVLLEKAMDAYETTLSAAERIGIRGAWKGRIEASLERVQGLLLEDDFFGEPSS